MLAVTEIRVCEVDEDEVLIREHTPAPVVDFDPEGVLDSIEVTREMVVGRTFVNSRGDRICIGMTERVQKLIGLPFAAFNTMSEELSGSIKSEANAVYELNKHRNMKFLARIKFLFGY